MGGHGLVGILSTFCISIANTLSTVPAVINGQQLTNHIPASMSEDAAPSMDEQCRIIASLVDEEPTSTYAYFVSAEWYNKWQSYVGYKTQQAPDKTDCPGSLTMHRNHNGAVFVDGRQNVGHQRRTIVQYVLGERPAAIRPNLGDDGRNMLVDEKIWHKWVQWYGVADSHELDRRRLTDSRQALFEMCLLNPYSTLVKKPKKVFDITEECGYIELQLRRIFGVTTGRKTKLWVCDNTTDQLFQQVLGRNTTFFPLFPKLNSPRGRPNSVSGLIFIVVYISRLFATWLAWTLLARAVYVSWFKKMHAFVLYRLIVI